jgi:tetratricopeptide (TPR) repeat protein
MSKKSKRAKLARPMKQLQHRPPSVPSEIHEQLANRAKYARQQMFQGDFAGCISTCESLLTSIPKSSALHIEVLSLLGLAHSMLQHHQASYDAFSTAIAIDPTMPELWYNHGLVCYHLGRYAEAVRDYERAAELSKDDTNEIARKIAKELVRSRRELQEMMEEHGLNITLEEYTEREEIFTEALNLVQQKKWQEAEQIFQQLAAMGTRIPSYWGNLGVCLMMQGHYDEAEEALKQALAIDPEYPFARDNLKKLPEARRGKKPLDTQVFHQSPDEEEVNQAFTIYEHNEQNTSVAAITVEKSGNTTTTTFGKQLGQQPPRYRLCLNTNERHLTTCPDCKTKTRSRKYTLVIKMLPEHIMIEDKLCRYCHKCDLLIVHKDQLEDLLNTHLATTNPKLVGNDYRLLGTLDRAEWDHVGQEPFSLEQVVEYLHDFKEVVWFEEVPG